MIVFSAFGSNKKESSELLAAKLNSISDTISQTSDNIKSTSLKATNSTLEINIANEIRDLEPIIANYGIKISKLSSSATKKESNADLLDLLEDARLNAIFDRTYAREMAYQLELLINLLDDIKDSNKDSDMQTFISSALTNLEPIQQSFADFSQADN